MCPRQHAHRSCISCHLRATINRTWALWDSHKTCAGNWIVVPSDAFYISTAKCPKNQRLDSFPGRSSQTCVNSSSFTLPPSAAVA
jgi:hypothetical protein